MNLGQFEVNSLIYGQKSVYRIDKVLGHGAISEVLLATNLNQNAGDPEQVAIKILKNTTFVGNEENKYFYEELNTIKRLCGEKYFDHIVNVFEVIACTNSTTYLIVMEYCQHGNLLDQMQVDMPDRLKVVVNFAAQLTRGLTYLHSLGIVHRDLKPENIFIHEKNGLYILKIGDYGLGKMESMSSLMRSCVGTINYMAPEMIRNELYDYSVDTWALGCIFHELYTGEQLFADFTAADIATQIKKFSTYQCVNGRFGNIIASCLDPLPNNRISVFQLYEALQSLYTDIIHCYEDSRTNTVLYRTYQVQINSQAIAPQQNQNIELCLHNQQHYYVPNNYESMSENNNQDQFKEILQNVEQKVLQFPNSQINKIDPLTSNSNSHQPVNFTGQFLNFGQPYSQNHVSSVNHPNYSDFNQISNSFTYQKQVVPTLANHSPIVKAPKENNYEYTTNNCTKKKRGAIRKTSIPNTTATVVSFIEDSETQLVLRKKALNHQNKKERAQIHHQHSHLKRKEKETSNRMIHKLCRQTNSQIFDACDSVPFNQTDHISTIDSVNPSPNKESIFSLSIPTSPSTNNISTLNVESRENINNCNYNTPLQSFSVDSTQGKYESIFSPNPLTFSQFQNNINNSHYFTYNNFFYNDNNLFGNDECIDTIPLGCQEPTITQKEPAILFF